MGTSPKISRESSLEIKGIVKKTSPKKGCL